jgi:hypothetical protein
MADAGFVPSKCLRTREGRGLCFLLRTVFNGRVRSGLGKAASCLRQTAKEGGVDELPASDGWRGRAWALRVRHTDKVEEEEEEPLWQGPHCLPASIEDGARARVFDDDERPYGATCLPCEERECV